ncbi:hypothetical protein SteCoe_12077 [Stentor coeruleus]|uniref:Uncharacterized protein n=1 Tax=Stentor coeruleus TaxID=5963 RepID=A0A1R2CBN8_9CILI|nr:hypothetical protein SteCoe_12077 [Stentor coeruleus]
MNHGFYDLMSVVLSELAKNYQPLAIESFIQTLYGKKITSKFKRLILNLKNAVSNEIYKIFRYNFIEVFRHLEELLFYDFQIMPSEIEIIKKNISELENLHTIKLINNFLEAANDISGFLSPKNLRYLKISDNILSINHLKKFSEKIKSSNIEKLTLKNTSSMKYSNPEHFFTRLIEAIGCSSLKILKVYIKYTQSLLDIIISRLNNFPNLEYLGLSIDNDYKSCENSIKNLISIVKNRINKLCVIKINKYAWDIEKIKEEKDVKVADRKLCPGDLMVLAELCEQKIIENISSVDLSENADIVDENFPENIIRVIKTSGCASVYLKNSNCDVKNKKEIKRLLKETGFSEVRVII